MKINILTLFPEMFTALKTSILSRAENNGKIEINLINIRDFSKDKNKKCDDYPYGGGAGMVMLPQPLYDAIHSVKTENSYVIYTSPKGSKLNQKVVERLAKNDEIIIVCGHYEGIDQRIIDSEIDEEISIGDYVLTGGELPAMVIADTISRYVPGVINSNSLSEESFAGGLLEYPQYTRPADFMGQKVPDVLLSGHHQNIEDWRKNESINLTKKRRPDIL